MRLAAALDLAALPRGGAAHRFCPSWATRSAIIRCRRSQHFPHRRRGSHAVHFMSLIGTLPTRSAAFVSTVRSGRGRRGRRCGGVWGTHTARARRCSQAAVSGLLALSGRAFWRLRRGQRRFSPFLRRGENVFAPPTSVRLWTVFGCVFAPTCGFRRTVFACLWVRLCFAQKKCVFENVFATKDGTKHRFHVANHTLAWLPPTPPR